MRAGVFIKIEKKIHGFDPFVNGKAVEDADVDEIDAICAAAGVNSLWYYLSQDPEELAAFLEDEGMEAEDEPEAEQWYEPEEGLSLVEKLSGYLKQHPKCIKNSAGILADLEDYKKVFVVLVQKKVKWHFAEDL